MTIEEVMAVAIRAKEVEMQIEEYLKVVDALKEVHAQLMRKTLPDMFRECGITEVRTPDGKVVKFREFYVGRITEEKRAAAMAWLREHNCIGIAKDKVTIEFGRDMDDAAEKIVEEMQTLGVPVTRKQDIHHATLNKFVSEQMEEHGETFPQELFGVAKVSEVTIK